MERREVKLIFLSEVQISQDCSELAVRRTDKVVRECIPKIVRS